MTQETIEEILAFAAERGITVTEIAVPAKVLAEYSRSCLTFSRAIVTIDAATAKPTKPVKGCVNIVSLG